MSSIILSRTVYAAYRDDRVTQGGRRVLICQELSYELRRPVLNPTCNRILQKLSHNTF